MAEALCRDSRLADRQVEIGGNWQRICVWGQEEYNRDNL